MIKKVLLMLILVSIACIVALTLTVVDSAEVDTEKTAEKVRISDKPSVVTLATAMKSFRRSLNEELLADASFPLGHKEMYSWSNLPPSQGQDRGGIEFSRLSEEQSSLFYKVLAVF